ncbi:hypothetical protein RvY_19139 [Ramazzottius varieornatus]|uniref:DNA-directed DNA polymerase n=1 Tax=Ramazzottius varieornatus TaxID=947166 RepID=A0A1D1W8D2_RAMVA|nr:hypothetical protein RvY_19139 [Ramazzottius varieornatus]
MVHSRRISPEYGLTVIQGQVTVPPPPPPPPLMSVEAAAPMAPAVSADTGEQVEEPTWTTEHRRHPTASKWKKKNKFDVNRELIRYCVQDVRTLKACAESLRQQFQDLSGGLCIFSCALTIAGVCGYFWRCRMLREEEVELVHRPSKRASSVKAQRWLRMMADEDNVIEMETEVHIGSYYVDGFDNDTSTVYEFYGCLHHGHDTHTRPETVHPWLKQSMGDLFRRTMARERQIIQLGYRVKSIWECEFDRLMKSDAGLRRELDSAVIVTRLEPRASLYGGRVNGTVLHHRCRAGEEIHYRDVISEYPFVNKTKRYPVGKHTVITRNFVDDVTAYFGLLKIKILPPRDLWIPVLPYRTSKLTFPLCLCADTDQCTPCQHDDEERALLGVWCSPEVEKAFERGYRVLQCYEMWHYSESRERLVAEYIDHFLALKTQASDWPAGVKTDAEKEAFLRDFLQTEGVQLDREKMEKTPGMRALAKLCLKGKGKNLHPHSPSFLGKLAMRDNKPATIFIKDPHKFHEFLNSTQYNVTSFDLINEDVLQLSYTLQEEFVETNPKTNVVLAAFTTAHARLHLLQYLEMCGRRTLYFDTDSIIYVCGDGDIPLSTGNTLGCLTSELEEGEHIVEFCATGAKSYSYITNKGHAVCKVKGFTLTRCAGRVINFHTMRDLLTVPGPQVLPVHYPFNIRRRKRELEIDAVPVVKKFQPTYTDKRVVDTATWASTPYGYDMALL